MVCPKCKHERTKLHGHYGKNRIERYRCLDCSVTFTANNHKLISSMNISREKQNMILDLLVEGMSIRAIARLTGVEKKTILRLLVRAGNKCKEVYNRRMVNLHCENIQCDELWTFCFKKEERIKKGDSRDYGDKYIFTAIDSDTKLVPVFHVGQRDTRSVLLFMSNLRSRLANMPQLTTDGFGGYTKAIPKIFGWNMDYAQLIKKYHGEHLTSFQRRRYAPDDIVGVITKIISGFPKGKSISTSFVERQNLTMRMGMRRFTRLTNAFSKKGENLMHMLYIYFVHYNFIRVHSSLKTTPAVKGNVAESVWTWDKVFNT